MIYKREEYMEEGQQDSKFSFRRVDVLEPLDGGGKKFVGHLSLGLQTPVGVQQIPLSFEVRADSVEEAFQKFDQAAEPKVEEARKSIEQEVRRMREESSRRIVRPDEVSLGGPGKVIDLGNFKK